MYLPFRSALISTFSSAAIVVFSAAIVAAQSSLLEFPTPILSNELSGTIKARDIGDPRVTTYYFWFEAGQGDVFINVVTRNFAGDIDIFVQTGLKPLTKIVVYPDFGEVETGRVLYLRKPERLLLRVQGRTPNDDPASFRMKFAGSFLAASPTMVEPVETPKIIEAAPGPVSVNSVGTIVSRDTKPVDAPKSEIKRSDDQGAEKIETTELPVVEKQDADVETPKRVLPKIEVVVTDASPKGETETKPKANVRASRNPRRSAKGPEPPAKKLAEERADERKVEEGIVSRSNEPEKKVDPLADVRLVVVFKDGRRIERPMPEVFRFSVDRGVLTVVSKDGRIGRYQMVEVAKVTIE